MRSSLVAVSLLVAAFLGVSTLLIPIAGAAPVPSDKSVHASPAVTTIPVGQWPGQMALDTINGFLYVPDADTGNLTVINTATNRSVASINLGMTPDAAAFDSGNGFVYVTGIEFLASGVNPPSINVTAVVNTANDSVVRSIPVGSYPVGIVYDPVNGHLYVANSGASNVTVIDGAANRVVGSITVGKGPRSLTMDSQRAELFVSCLGSGNVSIVDTRTDRAVGSIPVSQGTGFVTEDLRDGLLYVSNASGTVSILNVSSQRVVTWAYLGSGATPWGLAWDSLNGYTYVAVAYPQNLIVFNGTQQSPVGSIHLPFPPIYPVYDPENGYLYVTTGNGVPLVLVVNPATNGTAGPSGSASWLSGTTAYFLGGVVLGVAVGVAIALLVRRARPR